tara:strand:+ start:2576 stop:2839 length:264 start_codon:yes stop_codon:yes gene_type:complete
MKDKDRIKQLEKQLAQKYTYIDEINEVQYTNLEGQLHLGYGEDDDYLIINVDTLYRNLSSIISMVTKENTKQQEMYAKGIKKTLEEL